MLCPAVELVKRSLPQKVAHKRRSLVPDSSESVQVAIVERQGSVVPGRFQ